ncbi:hypothetical protein ABB37_06082 [Leptomonas pyrrhocoris]|uniref:Transmembrane protein n=1 Tax=Leptomonas pyrrhocoris TaxID=157538 RepID=A0A0M9FY32_LEPPY|nr:hypothetical protein ABB37_06082 [Leptomonas pyrrhocoris]KPA78455.1 hypothetical protein ABB37_06082 [Leptomonas pyrrhocoris]|eukprot:XP_015656894.1 hypothetical protein ABB37_06082 [Leptomonas pyrrhocoris]
MKNKSLNPIWHNCSSSSLKHLFSFFPFLLLFYISPSVSKRFSFLFSLLSFHFLLFVFSASRGKRPRRTSAPLPLLSTFLGGRATSPLFFWFSALCFLAQRDSSLFSFPKQHTLKYHCITKKIREESNIIRAVFLHFLRTFSGFARSTNIHKQRRAFNAVLQHKQRKNQRKEAKGDGERRWCCPSAAEGFALSSAAAGFHLSMNNSKKPTHNVAVKLPLSSFE